MPRREHLAVAALEPVGLYTLLRLERGGLAPGRPGQFFMLEAPGCPLPNDRSFCACRCKKASMRATSVGVGRRLRAVK